MSEWRDRGRPLFDVAGDHLIGRLRRSQENRAIGAALAEGLLFDEEFSDGGRDRSCFPFSLRNGPKVQTSRSYCRLRKVRYGATPSLGRLHHREWRDFLKTGPQHEDVRKRRPQDLAGVAQPIHLS